MGLISTDRMANFYHGSTQMTVIGDREYLLPQMNVDSVDEEKPELISYLSLIRDSRDPSLALGI
jgi:hypothetical protein